MKYSAGQALRQHAQMRVIVVAQDGKEGVRSRHAGGLVRGVSPCYRYGGVGADEAPDEEASGRILVSVVVVAPA